ncbi:hypothetical protein AWB82_02590 [Caballeronia glebae]|jgi:hypothetical protein|uniref:DUF6900 domain-containing protein n=1 Tax=Caballeronia glebae TaxID=1777143 RepID=A0A158AMZ0_9BURK|nr:hypothetical protein [Caballeronia glebae]SAK58946.1 hypothetical protein AWB82_02590 [Caballeronia glebae]
MNCSNKTEPYWEPLLTIAYDELGIQSFDPMGKPSADIRMCRVEEIGRALERAYDLGLLVGNAVTRAERGQGQCA